MFFGKDKGKDIKIDINEKDNKPEDKPDKSDKPVNIPSMEQLRYEIFEAAMADNDYLFNELNGEGLLKKAVIGYLNSIGYIDLKQLWLKAQTLQSIKLRKSALRNWKDRDKNKEIETETEIETEKTGELI